MKSPRFIDEIRGQIPFHNALQAMADAFPSAHPEKPLMLEYWVANRLVDDEDDLVPYSDARPLIHL